MRSIFLPVILFAFPLWFPHRWAEDWLGVAGRAWPSCACFWGAGLQHCWVVMGDEDHREVRVCEEEAKTK